MLPQTKCKCRILFLGCLFSPVDQEPSQLFCLGCSLHRLELSGQDLEVVGVGRWKLKLVIFF